MKKILYSLLAGFLLLGPMSCKKDDPAGPALASSPEANAAEDSKSGGVYKGILIGSTGTIKIVLQGGKKEITIKLDGVTKTLTTADLSSWTSGEEILDATFTKDDWHIVLTITADGSQVSMGFSIPGHDNIEGTLLKERSDKLIMAFEGTYAGSESGTWNFIIQDEFLAGIHRSTTNSSGSFYGTVNGTAIEVFVLSSNVTAAGTINGNTVTGTWEESADYKGTWTGTRTM